MKHAKYWIALEQTKGMGPVHLNEIYEALGKTKISVIDLFDLTVKEIKGELALEDTLAEGVAQAKSRLQAIEEDYFGLLESGIDVILFFEDSYPARLRKLLKNAYPPVLYVYGNRSILKEKGTAILGEKNASEKGELITYLAARELIRHHIVVISGFARGVDTIAHRSAMENAGTTIALLPYGFAHLQVPDILKESFNPDRILLVSPFYISREYSRFTAMQRNKIICALSKAVYIVESPAEGVIMEAGKSARNIGVPLYVTEYSKYPDSAAGNPELIREMGAVPVRGRMMDNVLHPNLDRLIGDVKFGAG